MNKGDASIRMTREEYELKWGEKFTSTRMIHDEPTEQDCDCLSMKREGVV